VLGGEVERVAPVLAHSCAVLETKADKNRFFHPPLAAGDEEEAETPLLQA